MRQMLKTRTDWEVDAEQETNRQKDRQAKIEIDTANEMTVAKCN